MRGLIIIGAAILLAILLQLLIGMVRAYIRDKKNLYESQSKTDPVYKSDGMGNPPRIGGSGHSTDMSALVELLGEEDERVCANAVDALVEIGEPAVPVLIEAIGNEEVDIRQNAIEALGDIGEAATGAVPALIEVLGDIEEDQWVRQKAAVTLGAIGHPSAVPVLAKVLGDKAEDERTHQFYTSISQESPIASSRFNPITGQWSVRREEDEQGVRECAALALCMIGESAVPVLIEALQTGDGWLRQKAAEALGAIGAPEAVPALIEALRDEDEKVREWGAVSLGVIGNPALPGLTRVLRTADMDVREGVIDALTRIGTPEAMETLKAYAPNDLSDLI